MCVGFGPASGGFLTTLSRGLRRGPGAELESGAMPGMPLQVVCYERADDLGFGVSGVVTRATRDPRRRSPTSIRPRSRWPRRSRARRSSTCSTRSAPAGAASRCAAPTMTLRGLRFMLPVRDHAFTLPLHPDVPAQGRRAGARRSASSTSGSAAQLMADGAGPALAGHPGRRAADRRRRRRRRATRRPGHGPAGRARGRLPARHGHPRGADGRRPTAPSARSAGSSTSTSGCPRAIARRDWAIGMKMVVDLPEDCALEAGHRAPHDGLPRAGDLRLPVRPPAGPRLARDLRAVVARQPGARQLPLPAALDAAPLPLAAPEGRQAALVGGQVAAGVRSPGRAPPGAATATRGSARARAARTC